MFTTACCLLAAVLVVIGVLPETTVYGTTSAWWQMVTAIVFSPIVLWLIGEDAEASDEYHLKFVYNAEPVSACLLAYILVVATQGVNQWHMVLLTPIAGGLFTYLLWLASNFCKKEIDVITAFCSFVTVYSLLISMSQGFEWGGFSLLSTVFIVGITLLGILAWDSWQGYHETA